MELLDLTVAYRISISTVVSPNSCFNVVVTYEQGSSTVVVTVSESEYVITYSDKKMIIQKDDCDTDRLFQLCTVYPFTVERLMTMIVDCSRIYNLLSTLCL